MNKAKQPTHEKVVVVWMIVLVWMLALTWLWVMYRLVSQQSMSLSFIEQWLYILLFIAISFTLFVFIVSTVLKLFDATKPK